MLRILGEDAPRYAAAFGIAAAATVPTLAVDALASGFWTRDEVRRRLIPAAVCLLIATVTLLLSPLGATWSAHRAAKRLAGVKDDQVQTVVSTLGVIERTTAILEDARAFASSRSSATTFLANLTRRLPRGTVLVSLELADTAGELVALTTSPAEVLAVVRRLPGVRSVELAGPGQHQTIAGQEVQRIAVRWQRGSR